MDTTSDEKEVVEAAKNIQRVYGLLIILLLALIYIIFRFRGHLGRKRVRAMRKEELVFLGMDHPQENSLAEVLKKTETNRSRRKLLQQQYEEDYQQALISIKEKYAFFLETRSKKI